MAKAEFLLIHYYQVSSSLLLLREEQHCSRCFYLIVRIWKQRRNWLVGRNYPRRGPLFILSLDQFAFVSHSYLEELEKQIISTNK